MPVRGGVVRGGGGGGNMSYVVKGLDFPSSCDYCPMVRFYPENGNVWCNAKNRLLLSGGWPKNKATIFEGRMDFCPLEQLALHDERNGG